MAEVPFADERGVLAGTRPEVIKLAPLIHILGKTVKE